MDNSLERQGVNAFAAESMRNQQADAAYAVGVQFMEHQRAAMQRDMGNGATAEITVETFQVGMAADLSGPNAAASGSHVPVPNANDDDLGGSGTTSASWNMVGNQPVPSNIMDVDLLTGQPLVPARGRDGNGNIIGLGLDNPLLTLGQGQGVPNLPLPGFNQFNMPMSPTFLSHIMGVPPGLPPPAPPPPPLHQSLGFSSIAIG